MSVQSDLLLFFSSSTIAPEQKLFLWHLLHATLLTCKCTYCMYSINTFPVCIISVCFSSIDSKDYSKKPVFIYFAPTPLSVVLDMAHSLSQTLKHQKNTKCFNRDPCPSSSHLFLDWLVLFDLYLLVAIVFYYITTPCHTLFLFVFLIPVTRALL